MKPAKNNSAETEAIKLLHELDVFKEELHMQNEELVQAVVNAETATALYDFAPSGYFTLDCDSNICELNLSGAMMLGKERSRLIHSNFKFFLSTETLPVFISFTDKLFESKNKQTCEVQLSFHGKPAIYLHIEGIVSFQDSRKCLITAVDVSDLKRSELAMRESAYFFKESQNAAFIGSYKADFTADHWDSSEVLDQIFGIDKNYHRSVKGWLDLVHPDDKAMMNDHLLTDIFKHRNPFNKEYRIVRIADGEIRWVHGLGEVSFDNAGHPLLLIGTIQDITERHLAETKLIQSEKKYKLLAENTKDVIWVLDPERVKLIYVSPSVEHLLGYTPDEVLNIPFEMILTPELRPVFVERYKKKVAEFAANPLPGAGSKNEVIHVRKDGTLVVTEIVINFYMNEDNGKVEIQGVSRDITEQKRAENALKFNEERAKKNNALLRSIFESSHGIIIFSLDLEFRYTAFTFSHRETMKAIWGVDIELGMHMPSLINRQDDRNSALANFKRAMQGDHFIQMEVYGEEPFRRILWENRYSPIYSDEHKVVGLTVFVTDITERRKAEETIKANEARLKELNATKDKFFSIIAHDLKSPFNAIIGFSNLLVEQMQEKDYVGIEEYASIIKESSLRAMSLLANLLEWSRSQTGKMEYNPEYLELVILIGEVTDLLNDVARQKSIIITRKLPHNILVLADKSMISTILRNLVSNAIKFTNPGGTVNIAAKSEESDWVISVQDTGIGIHQDDVNKLFRIDETYSTKGTQNETGTGLGLLLCKEFITKHNGRIWVESEFGKGSTFSFTIPKF